MRVLWLTFGWMAGCCSTQTCPPEVESGGTADTGAEVADASGAWTGTCEDATDTLEVEMSLTDDAGVVTGELVVLTGYATGPTTIEYVVTGTRNGADLVLQIGYAATGAYDEGVLEAVLEDDALTGRLTDTLGTDMSCRFTR